MTAAVAPGYLERIIIAGAKHEVMMETDDLRALFWEAFDRLAKGVLGQ